MISVSDFELTTAFQGKAGLLPRGKENLNTFQISKEYVHIQKDHMPWQEAFKSSTFSFRAFMVEKSTFYTQSLTTVS